MREFQSTPLTRGETRRRAPPTAQSHFNPLPSHEGRQISCVSVSVCIDFNPLPSHEGRPQQHDLRHGGRHFNPLPSHEGRHQLVNRYAEDYAFQSTPLTRGETCTFFFYAKMRAISIHSPHTRGDSPGSGVLLMDSISIHSPHTRGDSISLQKSIRIYVSLHNKTMIHRFSGLYKPLFAAQSPIFGVRSPRESHDSFTFARPSAGRGITP